MYGKVFDSMFDGTLASRGPWQALVTFQQMIVLANKDGMVDMTPDAISRRTSIPLDIIELGIAKLMEADENSRTPDEDGRRIVLLDDHRNWGWQIVNHAKYQAMRSAEERREYLRKAQADRRARIKSEDSSASTPVNNVNSVSAKVNTSTPEPAYLPASATEEKRKEARKRATPCPEDVRESVWQDWTALRKAKRATVSDTVLEEARREAKNANMSLEAFLREWCIRGSQGLKADWLKPAKATQPTFKERDAANARADMARWTGGRQGSPLGDIIDMESQNARLESD